MDILKTLGLEGQRVLIIHHDDLGMTHALNQAHHALTDYPTGAIMMPTTWATEWAGRNDLDLGVHLTLTSEWTAPRYRPLTDGASLRDAQGCFWRTVEEAWAHLKADEVEAEFRAQIEAALAMGVDITHLDSHMGTAFRPDIAEVYHRLGVEYRVPVLLPTLAELEAGFFGLPRELTNELKRIVANSPLPQVTLIDGYGVPPATRKQWYIDTLRGFGPGLYEMIHHAALPTPEGQFLPDWEGRRADYESLCTPEFKNALNDFRLISLRQVRDAVRATTLAN